MSDKKSLGKEMEELGLIPPDTKIHPVIGWSKPSGSQTVNVNVWGGGGGGGSNVTAGKHKEYTPTPVEILAIQNLSDKEVGNELAKILLDPYKTHFFGGDHHIIQILERFEVDESRWEKIFNRVRFAMAMLICGKGI